MLAHRLRRWHNIKPALVYGCTSPNHLSRGFYKWEVNGTVSVAMAIAEDGGGGGNALYRQGLGSQYSGEQVYHKLEDFREIFCAHIIGSPRK